MNRSEIHGCQMAGKKKRGGGKKKKGGDGAEKMNPENEMKLLSVEISQLQMQVIMQHTQTMNSKSKAKELTMKYQELSEEFDKENKKQFIISMNMTRQYKLMREKLTGRIYELSKQRNQQKEEMERVQKECTERIQEKEEIIANKDKEIASWKLKNEEMAKEFGQMLKQTLDKMSEKIVISNENLLDQYSDSR